ncbi:MAG: bifunctional folylpolyglutamate synthase/dihydrofolate synthase [Desulfobacterales bacterium]|nr:bifunctional folylpolyglutamate synthase/dihydrofolate synthase [Desulfobacterales bacterium]
MNSNPIYNDCLQNLYQLRRFGIKLGLSPIRKILEGLGNPQNNFACIHVAGTNGKGSIASALASILHTSGYHVGLYTSPHLVRFNERIRINNQDITDNEVVTAYNAVSSVCKDNFQLTFFEYATAMALYEFARQNMDWAIIETGMGGRLDATNVVQPILSIISNISLEHQIYLGSTLAQIAGEKGGIIKNDAPVITGVKQKNALSVLKEIARTKSVQIYCLGKEFRVKKTKNQTFTYFGIDTVWPQMQTGLLGSYQVDNAALVLAACELLNRKSAKLPLESIRKGLSQNRWPGRLEVVCDSPLILLDGAHNLAAARNLAKFLHKNITNRKLILIIGILNDKPYAAMLRHLLPVCSKVILTRPKIDRSIEPQKLYDVAKKIISDVEIIPDINNAVEYALKTASPQDAVCISGSLYVVGEAKEALDGKVFLNNMDEK